MILEAPVITIGVLAILEALIFFLFPGFIRKTAAKYIKSNKTLRKAGLWELILGIILIILGMNI